MVSFLYFLVYIMNLNIFFKFMCYCYPLTDVRCLFHTDCKVHLTFVSTDMDLYKTGGFYTSLMHFNPQAKSVPMYTKTI